MVEMDININDIMIPLRFPGDMQDAESILSHDLTKNLNKKEQDWSEELIAARQMNEMQKAVYEKDLLYSQVRQKDDLKNTADYPFTSDTPQEEIPEQVHSEEMPADVCKQIRYFLVLAKQMVDNQRHDFLKESATESLDGDCTNKINSKIPSEVFKEGPIDNCKVDENIEKHMQFTAIEADKNIREILRIDFSKFNPIFSTDKKKCNTLKLESLEEENKDHMLKIKFLKDEKKDKLLKTESPKNNQKFLKEETENEMSKLEAPKKIKLESLKESLKDDQNSSKQGKDDKMVEVESLKNDQKFSKKEDVILKTKPLKDDHKSSKRGKNNKILQVELLKTHSELSKEKQGDETLKVKSLRNQEISKEEKGNTILKTKFVKNEKDSSKGEKEDETLKAKSSRNGQKISKERKGNITLQTKFVKNEKKTLNREKEDETLKVKSSENDQEISEKRKDNKMLKVESLNDDQESSEEKQSKDFKDIKLGIGNSMSVENSIEKMESSLSTSIREDAKKSMNEIKVTVETQKIKYSKDQKSPEKDHPENEKSTTSKIPKEPRFKNQILNAAPEIDISIDRMLETKYSKFCEKTTKNKKKDEKLKAESLKSDQEFLKEGGEERLIKESLENQESSERNDQENSKDIELNICSYEESAETIQKIVTNACKRYNLLTDAQKSLIESKQEEIRNTERMEDDKETLKGDYSKDTNSELQIVSENSKKHAIKDQGLDKNHSNKLPQTRDFKDNQEALNEDHPENINDTKSSNLEQTSKGSSEKNSLRNAEESAKTRNASRKALGTDEKTKGMQKAADSKGSNDASDVSVPGTSALVPLISSLNMRPFILATYLVPSLSIGLFQIFVEIVEEVIQRPVVLMYEHRNNRLPCKEIVDMAILPADTEWEDGILLNASFVFQHYLNNNNSPSIYADIIVPTNLPSYITDILHLRGHGCIVPNRCSKHSAAGLLYDFLRLKGEGASFFGHTMIAKSHLAVLEAVSKQHTKLGIVDAPVLQSHKSNCCKAESPNILHSLGPLPPYRIMLNKYMQDHEIVQLLTTYLLNIRTNEKWMEKLSAYGIAGFAENSVNFYSFDDAKPVNMNVPYY